MAGVLLGLAGAGGALLVVEGLNGRSEWIRRAPLLVAHPEWNLLEGEPAFYLWADDPASKQQWLHALGWWCQDSERLAAIDAMYAAYCQSMRDRSLLEYPEHVPQLEGGGEPAGGAAGEAAQVAGGGGQPAGARRGWKGWGNRVQTMRRKMQRGRSGAGDFPGVDGELAAGGSVPPSPDKRGSLALRASPAKPSLLDAAATSAEMRIPAGAHPAPAGRMQRPEYIQPEAAIWPQVMFDMRYQGAFTVTIEMKGKPRGSSGGGGPPHAASAPSMSTAARSALEEAMYGEEGGEEEAPGSPQSSAASSAGGGGERGGGRKPRGMLGGFRQSAANKLRQLAENTAMTISRIPLRLSLTFTALEGRMGCLDPAPPGNRLFYSFVAPPHLELSARPELAGRLLKYSYHIARVSNWVEQRMRAALTKTVVFPGGGDLLLPMLLSLDHPNAADGLPSLGRYVQAAAAAAVAAAAKEADQKAEAERHAVAAREQEEVEAEAAALELQHAADAGAAVPADGEQQAATSEQQATAEEQPPMGARAPATVTRVVDARPSAPSTAASGMQSADLLMTQAEQQQAGLPSQQQQPSAVQQQAAAPAQQSAAPVQQQTAAPTQQQQAVQRPRTSSSQELQLEPSLSQLPSLEQVASGAVAVPAATRGGSAAAGGSDGHLIGPRYGGSSASEAAPGSLEFDIWAAAGSRGGPAAGDERGHPSAVDAWDAALAQERRASGSSAPTPRFASQHWQQPPPPPVSLDDGGSPPAAAPPSGRLATGLSLPAAGRPALQLRLSATRSLDPDFTSSAEHTRFGESPAAALPNYTGGVRRTLSARSDGSAGSLSARSAGGREPVGVAISRSLDKLRRQGGSLQHGTAQEAAAHAEHLVAAATLQQQQQAHQPQPQRPASPPQQQHLQQQSHLGGSSQRPSSPPQHEDLSLREQYSPRSPPHAGGSPAAAGGDPRGVRQPGSFKAQAKGFLTKVNAAGKALASQVHELQQQRAAVRQASRASAPGNGVERGEGSGGSPGLTRRSASQQAVL
ncbi:testis-expressed sequence 2 -like [Micractinium conductrix]|uniref:Testis-expressed sequence 2 -like n=1 Tax=Micractinium conductrix TaxID=554055 RepID=A0A2P6UZ57_9CHLO|nr:testis-expressed sequence 2 -like [Micractinium conductrix]|eukprot:PSC67117.1 testis-expressed sequence 2 -like [Micractinium conductrix]